MSREIFRPVFAAGALVAPKACCVHTHRVHSVTDPARSGLTAGYQVMHVEHVR